MGLFGKIFKGIGKVFKKVGKFIKKGFAKLGKFMNKFGILGQIGMMMMSYGIGTMAMAGLKAVGSGLMSGLSSAGWTTATAAGAGAGAGAGAAGAGAAGAAATVGSSAIPSGFAAAAPSAAGAVKTSAQLAKIATAAKTAAVTGTQVAAAGPAAGMARVAHGVFEGAAKIASLPGKVVGTITDQVVGTVTDVAKAFGNSMKMATGVGVDPVTGELAKGAVGFDDIFSNAVERFNTGRESVANAFGDIKKMGSDVLSGDYGTDYETFVDPSRPEILDPVTGEPTTITRNLKYSTENQALANEAVTKRQQELDIIAEKTDYNAQELEKRLNKDNLLTMFEPGTGPGKDFKFGADYQQAAEKVIKPGFDSEIYGAGSQSLLDATASQSGDYFGQSNIEGLSPQRLQARLGAGTANPQDYFGKDAFARAGEGTIAQSAQSLFTPQTPMEPTRYSMGPLRSGTPGIVDFTEAQAGIGTPVLANFVEGNAGVADPNARDENLFTANDWNSFFDNQVGFGSSRQLAGGNFAN